MIERNFGNIECVVWFIIGIVLLVFLMLWFEVIVMEWFVVIVVFMLIFNGVFSCCYVWFLFDLNIYKLKKVVCDM